MELEPAVILGHTSKKGREEGREGGREEHPGTFKGICSCRAQNVPHSSGIKFSITLWRRKSRFRTGRPGWRRRRAS